MGLEHDLEGSGSLQGHPIEEMTEELLVRVAIPVTSKEREV